MADVLVENMNPDMTKNGISLDFSVSLKKLKRYNKHVISGMSIDFEVAGEN